MRPAPQANYLEVDPKTKVVQNDGSDFSQVNPLGLVPTLRTDDGLVLTENAAILQYVADRFPQAGIATGPGIERSRLHQWLCFIGTELHKGLFVPVLDKKAPPEVKTYVLGKGLSRLDYLENYLKGREFLLDHFSVADAYLVTVINWTMATPPIELGEMAGRESLLRAAARAAQHRQGDRGGVRAVQGRTRAPQGGGVSDRHHTSSRRMLRSGRGPATNFKTDSRPIPAHPPAAARRGPVKAAIFLGDRDVVDAGFAAAHQAVLVELPLLVAVGAMPLAGIVVPLILKPHRDAIADRRPRDP